MGRIREILSSIVIFVYFFLLLRVDCHGSAPGDTVVLTSGNVRMIPRSGGVIQQTSPQQQQIHQHHPPISHQQQLHHQQPHHHEHRNSYSLLSEAMKQAVNHEFSEYLFLS